MIIATRESYNMLSNYTEYLCLDYTVKGNYKLFQGRYEWLGYSSDFYDDDKDDFVLPPVIDGKKVVGIEDDFVVGGELEVFNDDLVVSFDNNSLDAAISWLKMTGWIDIVNDIQLVEKIQTLK